MSLNGLSAFISLCCCLVTDVEFNVYRCCPQFKKRINFFVCLFLLFFPLQFEGLIQLKIKMAILIMKGILKSVLCLFVCFLCD